MPPEKALCAGGGFSRFVDPDRGVRTDGEQLLLAVEVVPESPQPTASGSYADVNPTPSESLCGLSAAHLPSAALALQI